MTSAQPALKSALQAPLTRYRVMAYATGVLLILLSLHVILQIVQYDGAGSSMSGAFWTGVFEQKGLDVAVPGAGHLVPILHGWLYLIYVITAVDLWQRTRLPAGRMLLVVLAGTVPLMSFVAEKWVTGRVRPMIAAAQVASGG